DGVATFVGNELGGVGVDRIGDVGHMALLHEDAHDIHRALGHAVGELLDRDRLRDRYFTRDLFLGLGVAMPGLAQNAAPECGFGSLTFFTCGKSGNDRQTSAPFFGATAGRLGCRGRASGGAAPGRAWRFVIVGFKRRTRTGLCRYNICAKALFGDLVSLAPGFLIMFAALFFFTLAR